MKYRYIPFGYVMNNGNPICDNIEADAVKSVFALYQNGTTYQAIAMYMSKKDICYHAGNSLWNKNMVKRILENICYLGNHEYPAIITKEQFDNVSSLAASKTKSFVTAPTNIVEIKPYIYCGECGIPFYRKPGKKCSEKWCCKNSDCKTKIKITDEILLSAIITLLNKPIQSSCIIKSQTTKSLSLPLEITRLQNEINREICKPSCNEHYVKTLIMTCAVEKYSLCDDGLAERETIRLKDVFTRRQPLIEFDADFFTTTINKVLVHQDGKISIQLKNSQILEMEG